MKRLGLVVLLMWGCQSDQHPSAVEVLRAESPLKPVVQVGDRKGDVQEFSAFWKKHPDLSRADALMRFEEQTLVTQAALVGLENETPELQMGRKREMVRLMLADEVEREHGEVTEAMRLEVAAELRQPRGFRASHILVMSKKQEPLGARGEAIARELANGINGQTDALDLVRLQREFTMNEDLRLHVDLHMVFPATGEVIAELPTGWTILDPAFNTAIEALSGPGVTPPFETQFGWHIAILHAELPAVEPAPADVQTLAQHKVDTLVRTQRYSTLISQERASAHYNTYPRVVRERAEEHP